MVKKIEILGGGCPSCASLGEQTEMAAKTMGLDYELEYVKDFEKIAAYGVMTTPALVVDGNLMFSGRVLPAKEIEGYLK